MGGVCDQQMGRVRTRAAVPKLGARVLIKIRVDLGNEEVNVGSSGNVWQLAQIRAISG
jgi:hypothetical protein